MLERELVELMLGFETALDLEFVISCWLLIPRPLNRQDFGLSL